MPSTSRPDKGSLVASTRGSACRLSTRRRQLLLSPPPPHVLELLAAGNEHQAIADRFVNGFDDPRDCYEWFMAPDQAEQYLAEVGAAS